MWKNALATVLVRTGALSAFHRGAIALDDRLKRAAVRPAWQRGAPVFMFHAVVEDPSPFGLAMSRAAFERFCRIAAESYDVLPLAELESRRRAGALPARALAITFDDGYVDNHDLVWPLLKEHGLPATLFVTTGTVGGERLLWFRRLAHIFKTAQPAELPVVVGPWTFTLDTAQERAATVERMFVELKKMDTVQREERISQLAEAFDVTDFSPLAREMLTWDQLRAMDAGGFSVEAHTVTHPVLSTEPVAAAAREIAESREILSDKLGRNVDLFAYPNGKRDDMTEEIVGAVRRAGYRAAFTAELAAASPSNDPYEVPRVSAYADTSAALRLQIERFFYMT